jgi:NDP-mannose synthase
MRERVRSIQNDLAGRLPSNPVRAVVLAGGKGTRLAPYTSVLPKPLMPIGDRAILEIVLQQLQSHDIVDVTLCVGHLSHLIEAVVGDGSAQGTSVTYVREPHAFGTAGPLRLVEDLDSTFIVMNGDILTTLDYRALLRHHREQKNVVTIAAKKRRIKVDYGVLHVGGNGHRGRLRRFVEKPEMTSRVSMGIYVMEPSVLRAIPSSGAFDFPDLIRSLLNDGKPIGVYDFGGLWFDIGRPEDYEQASEAWAALDYMGEHDTATLAAFASATGS